MANCTVLHTWWDPQRSSSYDGVIACCNRGPTRLTGIRVAKLLCEDAVLRLLCVRL